MSLGSVHISLTSLNDIICTSSVTPKLQIPSSLTPYQSYVIYHLESLFPFEYTHYERADPFFCYGFQSFVKVSPFLVTLNILDTSASVQLN